MTSITWLNLVIWPFLVPFVAALVTFFISMIPEPPKIFTQASDFASTPGFRESFLADLSPALFSHALWGVSALAARLDNLRSLNDNESIVFFLVLYMWSVGVVAHSKVNRFPFKYYTAHFWLAVAAFSVIRFIMYYLVDA